jgi:hypothetical protein
MNLESDANNQLISMTDAADNTKFGYTLRRGQESGSVISIRRTECDLHSLRNPIFAQVEAFTNDGAPRAFAKGGQNSMQKETE